MFVLGSKEFWTIQVAYYYWLVINGQAIFQPHPQIELFELNVIHISFLDYINLFLSA